METAWLNERMSEIYRDKMVKIQNEFFNAMNKSRITWIGIMCILFFILGIVLYRAIYLRFFVVIILLHLGQVGFIIESTDSQESKLSLL